MVFCRLLCLWVLPLPLLPLGWVHWMNLRPCSSGGLSVKVQSLSTVPFSAKAQALAFGRPLDLTVVFPSEKEHHSGAVKALVKVRCWGNLGTHQRHVGSEINVISEKMRMGGHLCCLWTVSPGEKSDLLDIVFCTSVWKKLFSFAPTIQSAPGRVFLPVPRTGNSSADIVWLWDSDTTMPCAARSCSVLYPDCRCLFAYVGFLPYSVWSWVMTLTCLL